MNAKRNSITRILNQRPTSSRSPGSSARDAVRPRFKKRFKTTMFQTQTYANPFENEMLRRQRGLDDLETSSKGGARDEKDKYAICSSTVGQKQQLVSEQSQPALMNYQGGASPNSQLNIVAPQAYQSVQNLNRLGFGAHGSASGVKHSAEHEPMRKKTDMSFQRLTKVDLQEPSQGALDKNSRGDSETCNYAKSLPQTVRRQKFSRGRGDYRPWAKPAAATGPDSTDGSSALSASKLGSMSLLHKGRIQINSAINDKHRGVRNSQTFMLTDALNDFQNTQYSRKTQAQRALDLYRAIDQEHVPQKESLGGSRAGSTNMTNLQSVSQSAVFPGGRQLPPSGSTSQMRQLQDESIQSNIRRSRPTTAKLRQPNHQILSGGKYVGNASHQNIQQLDPSYNDQIDQNEEQNQNYFMHQQSNSQLDGSTGNERQWQKQRAGHVQPPKSATQQSRNRGNQNLFAHKNRTNVYTQSSLSSQPNYQQVSGSGQPGRIMERENEMEELDTLSLVVRQQGNLIKKSQSTVKRFQSKSGLQSNRVQTANTTQRRPPSQTMMGQDTQPTKKQMSITKRPKGLITQKEISLFERDDEAMEMIRDIDKGNLPAPAPRRVKTKKSLSPPAFKSAKKEKEGEPRPTFFSGTGVGRITFEQMLAIGRNTRSRSPDPNIQNEDASLAPRSMTLGLTYTRNSLLHKTQGHSAGITESTSLLNHFMGNDMASLQSIQDDVCQSGDPVARKLQKYSQLDCSPKMQAAKKKIKMIQYECNTTVAAEHEKVRDIRAPAMSDGKARGPETSIDVIENCELICKVDVRGYKAPLKIYFSYDIPGRQPESNKHSRLASRTGAASTMLQQQRSSSPGLRRQGTEGLPDQTFLTQTMLSGTGRKNMLNFKSNLPELKIYVSNTSKTPDQTNSFQTFANPGYRIFIKKPENELHDADGDKDNFGKSKGDFLAAKKIDRQFDDAFKSKSIYLCFTSDKSFTMSLSCCFPNQIGEDDKKEFTGSQLRLPGGELREKFADEIAEKMKELEGNLNAQQLYNLEIERAKRIRRHAGLKNCEVNFIERNVEQITQLDQIYEQQMHARSQLDQKIYQANLRKEALLEQKLDRKSFDLIKWHLYRIKVDEIDEQYHLFKKRQLKIFWWLQLILVHIALRKQLSNFQSEKEEVELAARCLGARNRMVNWYRSRVCRKGSYMERRLKLPIRDTFTFMIISQAATAKHEAWKTFLRYLKDMADQYYMMMDFRTYYFKCVKIQTRVKQIHVVRATRQEVLSRLFDREKGFMTQYYILKSKKNKKLKAKRDELAKTKAENKDLILQLYYYHVAVSQNLKAAVMKCARDQIKKFKRESIFLAMLTDEEHTNLVKLEKNIKLANTFLLKGTKEVAPVGGEDEIDIYDEKYSPKKNNGERPVKKSQQLLSPTDSKLTIKLQKNLTKSSTPEKERTADDDEEAKDEQGSQMGDMESGGEEMGDQPQQPVQVATPKSTMISAPMKTAKGLIPAQPGAKAPKKPKAEKPGKAGKGGDKKDKSKSKGKKGGKESPSREATSVSPSSVKKGKKKKVKAEVIEVPWELHPAAEGEDENVLRFLPSRALMQRLILRAATIKEKEKVEVPIYEEVRPWVKCLKNQDLI